MRRALVGLMLVALVACSNGKSDDGASTTTAATTVAGELRPMPFYLPSFLPFGFKLLQGGVLSPGPARPALAIAIGKPDADKRFIEVVLVLIHPAAADRQLGPNQQAAVSMIDVNGTPARLLESGALGSSVDWFSNGMAVALSGPIGTADLLTDVAKRVRLGADISGASLASLPAGYEVIAENRFEDREPEETQSLSVGSETGAAISITVTHTTLPLVFVASGGDRIQPGKVRGHTALISTRLRQLESGPVVQSTIVWNERDDVAITLTGSTSVKSLEPIAEGMGAVSEAEWRAAVPS